MKQLFRCAVLFFRDLLYYSSSGVDNEIIFRNQISKIDKLTKMNVRLKTEMGVDSRSYWKNTHKAMRKISERLVKLANKVGQLY